MSQYNVIVVDVNGEKHEDLVESSQSANELLAKYQSTVNTAAFFKINGKAIKTDKVVSLEVY